MQSENVAARKRCGSSEMMSRRKRSVSFFFVGQRREDEQEQGKASQQLALSAPSGCNEGTSASSLELDFRRARGALGECGGAGESGTAKDRKRSLCPTFQVECRRKRMQVYEKYEWTWDERARCFEQKERRNSQGKDPQTFDGDSQERDPSTLERNNQGKDPRTFAENIQGGDFRTLETNSQGRGPRSFKEPVKRWRVRKRSGRKRRKEYEEKGEVLMKKELLEKVQIKDSKLSYSDHTTLGETSLGEVWKMALFPFAFGAELILPSLLETESIAPSFSPTTAPKLLSTATKTPPDFIRDSRHISRKPPSLLHLLVELLLHFLLPQPVLDPKEDVALAFISSHALPLYTPC